MTALIRRYYRCHDGLFRRLRPLDGVPLLALRLYLAPIFILAGWGKLAHFDSTVAWFGNPDWGLGLPMPAVMAALAGGAELIGGLLLVPGLAVRWVAIPLMGTMAVAAVTAHWEYGWHVLPESTLTVPWEWRTDLIEQANIRKARAVELLKAHGHYAWLTEAGSFTVLKNGIEWAATYFLMLLVLFFAGGGRYVSVDDWLDRYGRRHAA